jgi:hypothetical protein
MEARLEFEKNPDESVCDDLLKMLGEKEINTLEKALRDVCPYGEVRLVVERGRLRWLITQQSFDMNKLK